MSRKLVSTMFNVAVVVISAAIAIWLTVTGHASQIPGLLLSMGALLGAVIFGFRLAEGFAPDRLSIWAGPVWSIGPPPPPRDCAVGSRGHATIPGAGARAA